ncbi:DUF3221 domain-containing protein [Bacillus pinisoli]|uniref:DUF3221 domain-containing protein n=1 Tax=Bacillus pinisoli TaxID=2901866 RepID=UPI001FF503B1|nr:DUF3221 domain-containing protein [Bacillus pinisoli]
MIKRTFIGLLIGLFMILVSCTQINANNGVKDITGYMMSVNEDVILVTEKTGQSQPHATVYKITEETAISSEDGETLSLTDLSVGMQVEVWHTGAVEESFPAQATAVKMIVKTNEEALRYAKAIQAAKELIDPNNTWWVKSINEENQLFTITFSELMGDNELVVKVNEQFQVLE